MKTKEKTILWIAVVALGAITLASILPPLAAHKKRAQRFESVNNIAKPFPSFPRQSVERVLLFSDFGELDYDDAA